MRTRLLALVVLSTAALAACGFGYEDTSSSGERTLTVLAAASLRGTFTELAATFEEENPGVRVELAFAGSSDLVAQVQQGAPADVLASADEKNMATLARDGLVEGDPVAFATNTLVVVTPPDDPAGVDAFADLADSGTTVVVCAPEVPCGAAAVALQEATGVELSPASEEQAVTGVLDKVVTGEADAGLVYVTDARAAGATVRTVPVPEAAEVVNTYPVAALADALEPGLAADWVALVTGPTGREVLAAAGFGPP